MINSVDPSQWYYTFISIVFGVFFAVWIVPILKYYPDKPKEPDDELKDTLKTLGSISSLRGGVMFVMLVCLWWWYGTFIGNIAPAVGFWAYLFDFVSLCSFAIAFQMWGHRTLFPIVIFFAAGLMLVRFVTAYQDIESGSAAQSAMLFAIVTLALFMVAAVSALIGACFAVKSAAKTDNQITYLKGLQEMWDFVERSVLCLLLVGIGITFVAVWMTEGAPFTTPDKPEVWMKAS